MNVTCHKHKAAVPVIVWSCPSCFAKVFPQLASDPARELIEAEIETGMRAAIGCLSCARSMRKDGWELEDNHTSDHNRYMLFCPHEEDMDANV